MTMAQEVEVAIAAAIAIVYFVRGLFHPIIRCHSVSPNEAAAFVFFWLMLGMAAAYMQYRFGNHAKA